MSMIPLEQRVTRTPFVGNDPDYNEPMYGEPHEMECRFQEGVKLVRNQHGREVASVGSFYFESLPRIAIQDTFTYTNEIGTKTTYTPIAIFVKRDIDGSPILTEVNV